LKRRRQWRETSDDAFIGEQIGFNHWFKEQSQDSVPLIERLDTTIDSIDQTVERVAAWITERVSKDK
jgi:archaellum component FlaC